VNIRRQNTNLWSLLLALVVFIAAISLLYASEKIPSNYSSLRALAASVGSLLFASVAVTIIWELFQKRMFRNELLDYFCVSENIEQSGVERILYRFDEVDWKELFENCTSFDLFLSYGRSWRGTNETRLRELAQRTDAKVRLVLPDPQNADLMKQLSIRFRKTEAEVQRLANEAIDAFEKIFAGKGCQFALKVTDRPPTNAYYRFGGRRVVTLYNYKDLKGDVPVFVLKKPGRLADFFDDEFEYLFLSGRNRRPDIVAAPENQNAPSAHAS
jgi:hypothetical protein